MHTVFTYIVTLISIGISVFITLFLKLELERMFREKTSVIAFHICNVLIVLMVSFAFYAVFTIYIFEKDLNLLLQMLINLFIILPIYIIGNILFEKNKFKFRKYRPAEDGKVLVINEKYLQKKKR
ncbi:hypothetical protein E1I69_16485 [Bacillus timonensis]|uniref:Uncharacterized protein n=1 Tax=Bacillus timonensis TaxID=1033734 RepID=A0A4S3PN66_9BACI|nr:hypothetical protein [Bacillus timonensis]THE11007.1 hypothetical protein E1I69_16485 [Bacillus timonensis]